MKSFQVLPESSKLWIYQSDRELVESEVALISDLTSSFLGTWQSHGAQMDSSFQILYNRFIVIALDETSAGASGCGIDKSVNFIKELGQKFNIDFFNRLMVLYVNDSSLINNSTIKQFHFSTLNELNFSGKEFIFNNQITTKKEFENDWIQPIQKSWVSKHLSKLVS